MCKLDSEEPQRASRHSGGQTHAIHTYRDIINIWIYLCRRYIYLRGFKDAGHLWIGVEWWDHEEVVAIQGPHLLLGSNRFLMSKTPAPSSEKNDRQQEYFWRCMGMMAKSILIRCVSYMGSGNHLTTEAPFPIFLGSVRCGFGCTEIGPFLLTYPGARAPHIYCGRSPFCLFTAVP